jgi:hypothetical protein
MQAAAVWLASRLILAVTTYFTMVFNSPELLRTPKGVILGEHQPYDFVGSWLHWDGAWYLRIAQEGYSQAQSTAFFPLYPMLIRALAWPDFEPLRLLAAMLVSGMAALAGLALVGLLAAQEAGDEAEAGHAMRVTAAYPLAFFLAAPYTEALFLALAALTLLAVRRGSWGWAAPAAYLAGLTRPSALILILPLVIELLIQWRRLDRRQSVAALLAVAAVPLALGTYSAYLWLHLGQPLVFLEVQKVYWQRQVLAPWETAQQVWSHLMSNPTLGYWEALLVLDLGMLIGFAALTVAGARRLPLSFTAYMAGLVYLCLAAPNLSNSNPLSSSARFLAVAVPAFLLLGRWARGRPWLDTLVVGGGFMLQGVLLTLYLSGAWVA